jgi:uncharacterized protein Usg
MSKLIILPGPNKGIYRLTLAEILYYLPDYHDILQTYTWQEYDYIPQFPNLTGFLSFWEKEIEGKIHSVKVSAQDEPKLFTYNIATHEVNIH